MGKKHIFHTLPTVMFKYTYIMLKSCVQIPLTRKQRTFLNQKNWNTFHILAKIQKAYFNKQKSTYSSTSVFIGPLMSFFKQQLPNKCTISTSTYIYWQENIHMYVILYMLSLLCQYTVLSFPNWHSTITKDNGLIYLVYYKILITVKIRFTIQIWFTVNIPKVLEEFNYHRLKLQQQNKCYTQNTTRSPVLIQVWRLDIHNVVSTNIIQLLTDLISFD